MTDHITLTWPDGNNHPMRIVSTDLVSYPVETAVKVSGKKVIERTRIEFTIASARPATKAEVETWKKQP